MAIRVGRRQFISALGGTAVAWPIVARASRNMCRASVTCACRPLRSRSARKAHPRSTSRFRLCRRPHHPHRVSLYQRRRNRIPALLQELIGLNVDVLVVHATGVVTALRATKVIPIVMAVSPDLVALGLVESLAHPGGNITGSTFFLAELLAKRLELLKEIAPSMSRAGLLLIRRSDGANINIDAVRSTAKALNLELHASEVGGPDDFAGAFATWADAQVGGVVMGDHSLLTYNAAAIAALAVKQHIPSIGPLSLPEHGGLMGYGVDFLAIFRRAAYFVDQILKGAKPGDIPIEQPTKFELTVNL